MRRHYTQHTQTRRRRPSVTFVIIYGNNIYIIYMNIYIVWEIRARTPFDPMYRFSTHQLPFLHTPIYYQHIYLYSIRLLYNTVLVHRTRLRMFIYEKREQPAYGSEKKTNTKSTNAAGVVRECACVSGNRIWFCSKSINKYIYIHRKGQYLFVCRYILFLWSLKKVWLRVPYANVRKRRHHMSEN